MFNYDQCPNSSTRNYFQGYRLPDFVIIGTQKGGTTACRNNLALHRDIAIYRYEVHFSDDRFKKVHAGIQTCFADIKNIKNLT